MMERLTIPLLAVDGGGTKCQVVFADRQRQIRGSGRAGACNYQGSGTEAAAEELRKGIGAAALELRQTLGVSQDQAIEAECAVFGMAGLDTEYDRSIILAMVQQVLAQLNIAVKHLLVENDGLAVLLGATNGEPGVLVIAGTGSIAYGINEMGISARSGGWGHRVGDEGSGYWMGKQAIIAILQAADGRGKSTSLQKHLLPHLGLQHPEELFNWSYGPDYSVEKVGELSRFVSIAAAEEDEVAKGILAAAADELFCAARAVIDRLAMKEKPFKIILQGGVLQNDDVVRQLVIEKLNQYSPQGKLDKARNEPIYGVIEKGFAHLRKQG